MIGLMAKHTNTIYPCKINEPGYDDTLYEGTKRLRVLQEFGLEQMVMQFDQVSNASMVPIHMQFMDSEQLMLARMRETRTTTCGLTMRNIKECRVDSCLVQAGNKRAEDVLDKVRSKTRVEFNVGASMSA